MLKSSIKNKIISFYLYIKSMGSQFFFLNTIAQLFVDYNIVMQLLIKYLPIKRRTHIGNDRRNRFLSMIIEIR